MTGDQPNSRYLANDALNQTTVMSGDLNMSSLLPPNVKPLG